MLAHDVPLTQGAALLSRRHVHVKVSDDKASLVVENISTTQSVLVKRGHVKYAWKKTVTFRNFVHR